MEISLNVPQGGSQLEPQVPRRLWKVSDVVLITVAMIVALIAGVVGVFLATTPTPTGQVVRGGRTSAGLLLGVLAVQGVAMLGSVWLFGLRRRKISWEELGFRPVSWEWVLASLGLFVLLRILVTLIGAVLNALGITSNQAVALAPSGVTWFTALAGIALAGIFVPIVEEVFFRGVLYRWLRDKWGVAIGAIVSSLIFALTHGELATIIGVFPLGIVLALVFEKSRSLWPPIIIHAANNTFAIGLLYVLLAAGVPIPGVN